MIMSSSSTPLRPPHPLVDVDCNLLHPDLLSIMGSVSSINVEDTEIDDALKILHHPSTSQANIIAIISPSSTIDESEKSVSLLLDNHHKKTSNNNNIKIKTTVGVHPYHTYDEGLPSESHFRRINELISSQQSSKKQQVISCIGETGLDYSDGFPNKEYQIPWFKAQLELACQHNLPIFLHERLAFEDTLLCIDEVITEKRNNTKSSKPNIIVHCYTGSYDECLVYSNRGYYFSISGYICKPGEGSDEVKRCLRDGIIPLDKLMIETDSPYMGFARNKDSFFDAEGESFTSLSSKKRKRLLKSLYPNVPSSLPLVLEAVCNEVNLGREERGEAILSVEELAHITTNNAIDFFGL